MADRLHRTYLSKGAHATTAIEGNTLTEDEVSRMLDGPLGLPPSRRYLEQEVRNVLDAYEIIGDRVRTGKDLTLTPEIICSYNELVLRDVEWDDRIRPGRIRKYEVTVGRYRGPPAQDCAHLLNRRYDWLACSDFEAREDDPLAFTRVLTQGLLAHLYIAWIHPFGNGNGNGNGRTARLVEFHLLAGSGMVPTPAVHLLSNYYNQTRGPLLPGTGSVEPDTAVVAGRVHRLCTRWVRGRSRGAVGLDQGPTSSAGLAELRRRGDAPPRHGRRAQATPVGAFSIAARSHAALGDHLAHPASGGGLCRKDLQDRDP